VIVCVYVQSVCMSVQPMWLCLFLFCKFVFVCMCACERFFSLSLSDSMGPSGALSLRTRPIHTDPIQYGAR